MPSPRPRYRRNPAAACDALTRFFLEWGDNSRGRALFADDKLLPAWKGHGEQIIREWAAANPGTRPAGFWQWDAPEPRDAFREGETAYLERLALLLPGEAEAIEAQSRTQNGEP
ncbi:hypothetical protein OJF2_65230 [Aquisphaera giovannonii]|uniref:Uncharacterized protein n=1 Tax=Aquisphaera giovannonii TaxID=406548 RepID=A0A5B9WB78_9BACT|nr:hypothetical protein [Aquisphaera giovannonii]QEH37928.1 hypothetical protein OJF2_65230 [Aquisphaera giovannonii]